MLILRKHFKIGIHPDEKELVRKYLVEVGASILSIRYFKTEIVGHPITHAYIEGYIENERLDELVEWLKNNLKNIASITL